MFLRDMVVLGVWKNVDNFDKIDVASDVNTIKVALRTGIISTAIPLVSSFLDIFCHQYSYIDKMNALAWRRVWEIWQSKYPLETISSPCLMDYFVYGVIGKQFCKSSLAILNAILSIMYLDGIQVAIKLVKFVMLKLINGQIKLTL